MLKQLARWERTSKYIVILFAVLMAVSLVIFYAPGRSANNVDPGRNTEVVAKVGSASITVADVARIRENYAQMFGNRISLAQLGGNKRFLDGLIGKQVISQEAARLGLSASDAELADKIRKQFSDASGNFVGFERYKESVTARYGDIEKFENDIRDDIAQEKLRAFVTASVNVSDAQVEEEYKRRNTSFDVSYVAISTDKLATKIQPSDDELRSYYESHKTDYRYLEPQRKVRYIFVDTKPGDVTDIPIRYAGNWYILRRGESVPKTFAEAKPDILVSLRNRKAYGEAFKLAQKAHTRLQETKDAQKVAQELAAQANMTPAEMVRETPFVKPGDDVPEIGSNQQFEQAIETLNNPNDVGSVTGIKSGFAIPILAEKKEPRIPDFDEVKTKIADEIKKQRAKDQLEQKAKELVASLSGPDGIKAAGEKEGYEAGTEESFKLGSSLGKAGTSAALDDLIYSLKPGEFSKTPIKVDDKWVIVGVTKRNDADMNALAAQRDTLKTSMMTERQEQVFDDYVTGVEQQMKKDGKIKIYQEVLAQLQEEEPEAGPGLPPGLNFPTK